MSATSGRLLTLLSLLQARRDWPGQTLAERLEVTPRTVRRDIDRLRELGYPVRSTMGPDGGYRLDAGADLPPLLFDDDQAVALAVALQLAAGSGAGIADAAWRALATVRQVMPGRLRRQVDAVRVSRLGRPGAPEVDSAVLVAVTDAVRAREVLRFDYRSAVPEPSAAPEKAGGELRPPRRVEPHHVLTHGGRWYLLAWDLDRSDWRTFRVDRISPRIPTGPRFVPRDVPGGDPSVFVSAHFRGNDRPDVGSRGDGWPCRGEAVVRAPLAAVAPYVADDAVQQLAPDRCRVRLGAWSWVGLASSFAAFDADIEAVDPPELAEAFGVLARRAGAAAISPPSRPAGSRSIGPGSRPATD